MCARERLSVESLLLQWKEPAEVVRHLLRKRPASYWGNVFLVRPPQSRHPWRDWGSWLPSAFPQKSWGEGGIVTVGLIPHSLCSDEEPGWMDKWNFIVLICFIWILKKQFDPSLWKSALWIKIWTKSWPKFFWHICWHHDQDRSVLKEGHWLLSFTLILYTVAYHLLYWKHDKNDHIYFVFMLISLQIGTGASDRWSHWVI